MLKPALKSSDFNNFLLSHMRLAANIRLLVLTSHMVKGVSKR